MKLISTADTTSRYFKILFHGRPGTGKTLLTATAPDPVLMMIEPNGQDSLSPKNIEKTFGVGTAGITYEIPVLEAHTKDKIEETILFLESKENLDLFKTTVVDSVTKIAQVYLEHFSKTMTNQMQAYGAAAKAVQAILDRLRRLPQNTIFIAHSGEVGNDKTLMPVFEGKKLPRAAAHDFGETYFSDVDYADDGTRRYVIRTQKTEGAEAKSRLGHLADTVEPHWGKIFATLNAGIAKGVTKPAEATKK